MKRPAWWYVDSSAIVKLVVDEPWSAALREHVRTAERLIASELAVTEVRRALRRSGQPKWQALASQALASCTLLRLDRHLLDEAGSLSPPELRSLDALHLATAQRLRARLDAIITYDDRMSEAAVLDGWAVLDPGRNKLTT